MTALTIFIITLIIILLLLVQKLTIRFVVSGDYSITLDYSFFSMTFTKGDASNGKRKKKRYKPTIKALFSFALRIIKSSKITVNRTKIPAVEGEPFRSAIAAAGVRSSVYSILNLILSLAQSAVFSENAFRDDYSQNVNSPELDIVLETELYNIFFSGIILLYEELKRRIVKLNVRKSNK